jgi:hypothetical protein
MNMLNYKYILGFFFILWRDYIKEFGIYIDCKPYFYHHNADFLFSHAVKLLELNQSNTFFFSTIDSLPVLYFTWATSKLYYDYRLQHYYISASCCTDTSLLHLFASLMQHKLLF